MRKFVSFDIYGVRKAFSLLVFSSLFTLLGAIALFLYSYYQNAVLGYLFAGALFLVSLYILYLALYQGFFRYKKYLAVPGEKTTAVLSHFDEKGAISVFIQGEALIDGKLVSGRVYGTFDQAFRDRYDDGSSLECRYLRTGEFLALEKQKQK